MWHWLLYGHWPQWGIEYAVAYNGRPPYKERQCLYRDCKVTKRG